MDLFIYLKCLRHFTQEYLAYTTAANMMVGGGWGDWQLPGKPTTIHKLLLDLPIRRGGEENRMSDHTGKQLLAHP